MEGVIIFSLTDCLFFRKSSKRPAGTFIFEQNNKLYVCPIYVNLVCRLVFSVYITFELSTSYSYKFLINRLTAFEMFCKKELRECTINFTRDWI